MKLVKVLLELIIRRVVSSRYENNFAEKLFIVTLTERHREVDNLK
jgi:hypothetical protein